MIKRRILIYALLMTSFFVLPWWITVLLALLSAFLAPDFYEGGLVTLLVLTSFTLLPDIYILSSAIAFCALVFLSDVFIKPKITWYDK